jgi:hypothetical protein
MKDFNYFKANLNSEELDLVNNGKKYWKEKILGDIKTKRVTKEELFFLIDCVIENSVSNAKDFYNYNEEKVK